VSVTELSAPAYASVALEHVTLRAGKRTVVSDLTWSHAAGRIAWVIGENGAGKSSLLRALVRIDHTVQGTLRWLSARGSSYYAPTMHVSGDVRARDWLRLSHQLHPRGTHTTDRLLPVSATGDKRIRQLSTGEEKRLLLWALLRAPKDAIVLDEPYEHLSAEARSTLSEILRALAQEHVVIVSTNQELPPDSVNDSVLRIDLIE
jgi:ABC-type multidrug transport system ATPase subunit